MYCYKDTIYNWKFNDQFEKQVDFNLDADHDDDYTWQIFLSYNEVDLQVKDNIQTQLMNGSLGGQRWNVAIHENDFLPGKPILDNINCCVRNSKITILLLSRAALSSKYCMKEFEIAASLPGR